MNKINSKKQKINFKLDKIGTRYFYKLKKTIYYIQDDDNDLLTHSESERNFEYRYYEMQKGYDANLTGLKQYREDFLTMCDEINKDIEYTKRYETHEKAIMGFFKSKSTDQFKKTQLNQ